MTNKNTPLKYPSLQPYNKKATWLIVVIKTGEVVGKFRTKSTAIFEMPKIQKIIFEKCEVKRNEGL